MTRRSGKTSLEDALAALRTHIDNPATPAAEAAIRTALGSKIGLIVEAGAKLIAADASAGANAGDSGSDHTALVPLLAPAYARFVDNPVKTDPGCRAKSAIVAALCRLERDPDDVLLRAVRQRQPEPAWGPPVDTAAAMRGHAALGLARAQHPAAAVEIAHLLADAEWVARGGAARALGSVLPSIAVPLLRYKVLTGDDEPRVMGECFGSLLAVAADHSLPFVAERLADPTDTVAEQAAIALGESRLPAAFERLRGWFEGLDRSRSPRRRVALLALALLRTDASQDYLLAQVASGDRATATYALDGLAIHRHDRRVCDRVNAALARRKDRAHLETAAARFREL